MHAWQMNIARRGSALPPFDGDKPQVAIDGSAFASLLAGIDFTAARRGWYRRPRPQKIEKTIDTDPKCDLYSSVDELEALRRENAAQRQQITQPSIGSPMSRNVKGGALATAVPAPTLSTCVDAVPSKILKRLSWP
jgi:hypothetical protein